MSADQSSIPISIAPMIQWTDRFWRYYFRLISRRTLLYTEMVMDNAIYYNATNLEPFLGHHDVEHPLAIQLGGSNPESLGEAAYLCESFAKFHEINLNCGCPSNKAKKAGFGAELMLEPELVRQITHEMKRRVTATEITVKCRLGVTGRESFDDLIEFITNVKMSGITRVILHARSCVLKGLTPAQNRSIPPLHPEIVHKIVKLFPDMKFVLNGGLKDFTTCKQHLGWIDIPSDDASAEDFQPPVHGVMIGREAYHNPFLFTTADSEFFGATNQYLTRWEVLEKYLDYAEQCQQQHLYHSNTCNLMKPLHNIFHGCITNHVYKQKLDANIISHSKKIDEGSVRFSDVVYDTIAETIPKEFLHSY
jgi:tRNA-dihydrouridine synthase A